MRRLIVFDIDGTVFDTKKGIISALNYFLNQYGVGNIPAGEHDKYIGPPIKTSLMEYSGFSSEKAEEATNQYRKVYVQKYISQSELYHYLNEVLTELQNLGFELGIATMKTQKQVDRLLEIFDLTDTFKIVKTAREDGMLSKKQMLVEICDNYELGSLNVFMVGDTQGDYEVARNANCCFIVEDYGYGYIDAGSEVQHIEALKDILNIFQIRDVNSQS